MKLTHIMERAELIESVKFGEMDYVECEIQDWDVSGDEGTIEATFFGFDMKNEDAYINVEAAVDIDAREVDASFGYEYWGATGVHKQTDVEGGAQVTYVSIGEMDDRELIEVAKALRVPGRHRKDPKVVWKYFLHAVGGEKKVISIIDKQAEGTVYDDMIDRKLENDRDYDPY